MGIAGRVIKGVAMIRFDGKYYPLKGSNVKAIDTYIQTGVMTALESLRINRRLPKEAK